jgi:hypothetical protein
MGVNETMQSETDPCQWVGQFTQHLQALSPLQIHSYSFLIKNKITAKLDKMFTH